MREDGLYSDVNKFFTKNNITLKQLSTNRKNLGIYGVSRQPDFLGISIEDENGTNLSRVYMGEVKLELVGLVDKGMGQARIYKKFSDYTFVALPFTEWESKKIPNHEREDFMEDCREEKFGLLVINPTKWIIEPPLNPPKNLGKKLEAALKIFLKEFNKQVLSKYETKADEVKKESKKEKEEPPKKNAQSLLLQALSELGGDSHLYELRDVLGGKGYRKSYSKTMKRVSKLELDKGGLFTQAKEIPKELVTLYLSKIDNNDTRLVLTGTGKKECFPKFFEYLFEEFESQNRVMGE